ncbi:Putative mitochondrial protein, partial [Tolypocladium paradoxum]
MSKLSPSLKALINAPFARPGPVAAPAGMAEVYRAIARDAAQRRLGARPWVAVSVRLMLASSSRAGPAAATFTLNAPDALPVLFDVAAAQAGASATQTAELMREVGLKCISFNGIPRTINCLNAFRASLPRDVAAALSTTASRVPTPQGLEATGARGRQLWDSIYAPFEAKLAAKLARAHPDLP